jgi:phenylalanyl-tRNA synthetase alpha subunit
MIDKLHKILDDARAEVEKAVDPKALEDLRVKYLGKKGAIREVLSRREAPHRSGRHFRAQIAGPAGIPSPAFHHHRKDGFRF